MGTDKRPVESEAENLSDRDRTGDRTRSELLIWAGFGVAFGTCFLLMFLVPGLTFDQIGALFTIATCLAFVNHGLLDRTRIMTASGLVGMAITAVSLILSPAYFPFGWIVLGVGLLLTGYLGRHSRDLPTIQQELIVGLCIILGATIQLIAGAFGTPDLSSVLMVWMVLTGLIFISVGRATRNSVTYHLGISWATVTVVFHSVFPQGMLPALGILFTVGILVNFIHLYRLLGRTPRIGELFSFATRALFLHGLSKPIGYYRVIVVLASGNISIDRVIRDLMSRLGEDAAAVLLLGPTAPTRLSVPDGYPVGWVTTISGTSDLKHRLISPEDLTGVRVFLNEAIEELPDGSRPIIIGDFLDNMMPQMAEDVFHKFYSDLASTASVLGQTFVLLVNTEIHSDIKIEVVKRFADIIIENREREERGRLVRESRVTNLVDDIRTEWRRY